MAWKQKRGFSSENERSRADPADQRGGEFGSLSIGSMSVTPSGWPECSWKLGEGRFRREMVAEVPGDRCAQHHPSQLAARRIPKRSRVLWPSCSFCTRC